MNNIRRANKGIVWGIGLSDDIMGKTLQEYYPLLNIPLYIIQTLRSYYIHYKSHGTRKKTCRYFSQKLLLDIYKYNVHSQ